MGFLRTRQTVSLIAAREICRELLEKGRGEG